MSYHVVVGLPAYNEASALPKLLSELSYLHYKIGPSFHVVIVDDGSRDQTPQLLKEYTLRLPFLQVISHAENRGLGVAISSLFTYCLEHYQDEDVLITLDADNTQTPRIIPALVQKLKDESLNVVIASRFVEGGDVLGLSLARKITSRGAALFLKLFFPIAHVRDYSCGYRAYDIGYLRKAMDKYQGKLVTATGFECMAEILARFSRIGLKAKEYPLVLHYDLKNGRSKMNVTKTILGYFRLVGKVK